MQAQARRPRLFCHIWTAICVLALLTPITAADQAGYVIRDGFFKEITNSEGVSFQIETFRMSGDGSRVVYFGWNGTANELRVIDGDGSNDTLIEESEQHWGLLRGVYDISDDGSTIVYFRYTSIADPSPELVVYDVGTMATTQILKLIPVNYYGTPETWVVAPQEQLRMIRLSGDGSKVFFINNFGPVVGTSSSGYTIYSINTDGSGLTPVFQSSDIASIPGIGADTYSLVPGDGELTIDLTGSKLAVPMAGSWGHTDLVTMNGDGSNPTVIQDLRDGNFYGPVMSGDGTKLVYSRGGTSLPEDTGIFVTGLGLPQSPVQVEPNSGYWWGFPEMAIDGETVVYNFDLGGGSSPAIRWANASGISRLPITHPTVTAHSPTAMVAAGGQTIFMLGTTSRSGYTELIRFDFSTTPFAGMPSVAAVSGNPDMSIGEDDGAYTFYYQTSGTDLREMYSWPFTEDPGLLMVPGFWGFNTTGFLYDDGGGGDVSAGDGIFSDDAVYLSDPPPAGLEFFTVRAGVATDNGTAAFADYLCAFGDGYGEIFFDDFESGDTSAWSVAVP